MTTQQDHHQKKPKCPERMYYFTDEEVNGILKYKWFPEVGATKWECFLSDKLYKPLEYFIFWKLNANFLTLLGPLPMIALTIW